MRRLVTKDESDDDNNKTCSPKSRTSKNRFRYSRSPVAVQPTIYVSDNKNSKPCQKALLTGVPRILKVNHCRVKNLFPFQRRFYLHPKPRSTQKRANLQPVLFMAFSSAPYFVFFSVILRVMQSIKQASFPSQMDPLIASSYKNGFTVNQFQLASDDYPMTPCRSPQAVAALVIDK